MSHLIACVHATTRAIEPARQVLQSRPGEFAQRDVVEETLFHVDAASDEAFRLFLRTVGTAESLRPRAILTTCSMYTQHLPAVRRQLKTPIVGIDEVMLDRAAGVRGTLALVGSRSESIAIAKRQIEAIARHAGNMPTFAESVCVELDACDTAAGARQLAVQVRKLAQRVDAVVVVQLSLSPLSEYLAVEEHDRILTSPRLALEQLRAAVEESTA